MKKPTETVSFPEACRLLRKSREQVMRLIYLGELDGEQEPNGRWRITRASVDTLTR